jgi:hypothetical protein
VFVGLLGLFDAGYSGDWSRIEVLTLEQEAQARAILQSILTFQYDPTLVVVVVSGESAADGLT